MGRSISFEENILKKKDGCPIHYRVTPDRHGNIKKIAPVWAKLESKCEFHRIPNAGHCSNQDNPKAFNSLLVSFLRKHRPV